LRQALLVLGVIAGFIAPASAAHATACAGITIAPGSGVQNAINANPPGTTFCLSGTYHPSAVQPKANDTFDGGGTTTLNGQNTRQYAFNGDLTSPGPSGVTITGLRIINYATPYQHGAIESADDANWVISGNDIEHNGGAAITTGSGVQVLNNTMSNNQQEGWVAHGSNILYQGNTISGNNSALNPCNSQCSGQIADWEAGGGKAWQTTGFTFTGNTVTGNGGAGIWFDTSNLDSTITSNTVDCNYGAGIYMEIGYNFTITGNDVEGNGGGGSCAPGGGEKKGWAWGAGIQIRASQGCEGQCTNVSAADNNYSSMISGNTVAGNYNGVTLIDSPDQGSTDCQDHSLGEGAYGPCKVLNVTVQDNGITMAQGATGGYDDGPSGAVFAGSNHFTGNHYCVATPTPPNGDPSYGWFAWAEPWSWWSQWQADGNDTAGTFAITSATCLP